MLDLGIELFLFNFCVYLRFWIYVTYATYIYACRTQRKHCSSKVAATSITLCSIYFWKLVAYFSMLKMSLYEILPCTWFTRANDRFVYYISQEWDINNIIRTEIIVHWVVCVRQERGWCIVERRWPNILS